MLLQCYDAQHLPDDIWLNDGCVNGIYSLIYKRSQSNQSLPAI